MTLPFVPEVAPGLALSETEQVFPAQASPATLTVPIPDHGIYLCTATAIVGDVQNQMATTYIVQFFRGAANMLNRLVIVPTAFTSPNAKTMTALTINGPTTSNNYTVVATWTDGVSADVTIRVTMRKLAKLGT